MSDSDRRISTAQHPLARELEFAEATVRQAGEVALSYFRASDMGVREKAYLDVVTLADTECERLISSEIRAHFGGDAIVGEEGTDHHSLADRIWYIDPVDGTYNFSRRLPYWCVSLALVKEHNPCVGVIYDPLHQELFSAVHGAGAWLNGQRIKTGTVERALEATVQVTINFDRQVIEQSITDLDRVARNVMRLRNLGALALEFCHLACGRLDAVIQRGSHPWDYASALLIAQEAGAVVSTPEGEAFNIFASDSLACCTSPLQDELLLMLRTGPK